MRAVHCSLSTVALSSCSVSRLRRFARIRVLNASKPLAIPEYGRYRSNSAQQSACATAVAFRADNATRADLQPL